MSFSDSDSSSSNGDYRNVRQISRERLLHEMLRSAKTGDSKSTWKPQNHSNPWRLFQRRGGLYAATEIRQQAAREAEILKRVDSLFVVRCYAVFDNGDDLCFAMEYMEKGSRNEILASNRNPLPENSISGIARCVLKGLQYLHGMQIVHGDIKSSNLLINGDGEVKIADFGVSHDSGSIEADMGTCAYMSPERLDSQRWDGENADGFSGDVWAVGVVVMECLVGRYPLIGVGEKPDWVALVCGICFGGNLEMPEKASPEIRNFVERCLEKDGRRRGTVEELLLHPFVRDEGGDDELMITKETLV